MSITEQVDRIGVRRIERLADSPNFCKVHARRTPLTPFHNGWYRPGDKCVGCKKIKP